MDKEELRILYNKCKEIRILILEAIKSAGSGHVGGSFSAVETFVALYNGIMNINPQEPTMEKRDRFVLSKGHAGPGLYATLAERGYFPKEILYTLNQKNTNLPSHCDMNKTPGIDMTTGSLGQGISCAVGMAYASKLKEDNATIYCMVGDGECQEGQVWEAALNAANLNLNNLICFLDYNKLQLDGPLNEIVDMGDMEAKWKAFGFNTYVIDGHNLEEIFDTVITAKKEKLRPTMIILNTIKGKGVSFIENMGFRNHSMPVNEETVKNARLELFEGII